MKYSDAQKIKKWSEDLNGVFTLSDLKVLFNEKSEVGLFKKLNRFVEERVLIKIIRGLYAVPEASLEIISSRINPGAYISTGTVLARNMIIGSVPGRRVQAVKKGRPRVYESELGVIEHLSITPRLFFGFESTGGMSYATPEKAFLDVCYYIYKGKTFSFDPDSDVDQQALDGQLIRQYLKQYDKKFISFFRSTWRDD